MWADQLIDCGAIKFVFGFLNGLKWIVALNTNGFMRVFKTL